VAVLEVTGNPEGRIAEVRVLRDLQGMDLTSAAVEAVSQWEYEPLELGGEPVWFLMTVIVPPAARAQDSERP
jgi:outer membrane biosynthesis protein TonB